VAFSWDDNGNLLSDGVSTYTYDHANRLVGVDQGDTSYTFAYDGLGNRVDQSVSDGAFYTYTLDLAAGLTQVLDDGTTTYLYGRARVGEQQPEGWQYHLGDALGSVRELTTSTGAADLAQSFEPFGSAMATFGSASTAYSFTGEQLDRTGLTFLRARYYASQAGRFATADPARVSANYYIYALANPANRTDPSGLLPAGLSGPEAFTLCFDIHTGSRGILAATYLGVPYISAGLAVEVCRLAYSSTGWLPLESGFHLEAAKPATAHQLFGRFVFESGPSRLEVQGSEPLTRELAVSSLLQKIRDWFYRPGSVTNDPRHEYRGGETLRPVFYPFTGHEYVTTLLADIRNSGGQFSLPLPNVLGSFWYQVKATADGTVGFRVDNDMTLESGTHIGGRFDYEGFRGSVEDVINADPLLGLLPIQAVMARWPVLSILTSLTRVNTAAPLGGGNYVQTFVWRERFDPGCESYMYERNDPSLLDVVDWRDYGLYTVDPLASVPR
jgi:RHS repeat-associated protein